MLFRSEEDINKSEAQLNSSDQTLIKRYKKQIEQKNKHFRWLSCLKNFSQSQGIDFDFVIIKADQFNSGFGKVAFDELEIYFPELSDTLKFKDVANTLSSEKSERDKFYYIFYRRTKSPVNVKKLARDLNHLATEECY